MEIYLTTYEVFIPKKYMIQKELSIKNVLSLIKIKFFSIKEMFKTSTSLLHH